MANTDDDYQPRPKPIQEKKSPLKPPNNEIRTPPQNEKRPPPPKQKPPIDLSKSRQEVKHNDLAIVRIRDPVTSKVRTLYLNDDQIDELSRRHEQDKNKVNQIVNNRSSNNSIVEKPKVPIDTKRLYENENNLLNGNSNSNNRRPIQLDNDKKESIIDLYNKQQNESEAPIVSHQETPKNNKLKSPPNE